MRTQQNFAYECCIRCDKISACNRRPLVREVVENMKLRIALEKGIYSKAVIHDRIANLIEKIHNATVSGEHFSGRLCSCDLEPNTL